MNKVELQGVVDRIESKTVGDKKVTTFTVKVVTQMNDREFTNYVPVEIWRELNGIRNGEDVRVEGKFSTTSWDNPQGGKSYKSFVSAFRVYSIRRLDLQEKSISDYESLRPQMGNVSTIDYQNDSPEDIF